MRLRHALLMLLVSSSVLASPPAGFMQPVPGLYTGGQPDAAVLRRFADEGVVRVIDLRAAEEDRGYDEAGEAAALGLEYIRLPITGAGDLTAANAEALREALDGAGGAVLLHCASGNRVGALLALEAAGEGAAPEEALALGRRAGLGSLEADVRAQLGCERDHC